LCITSLTMGEPSKSFCWSAPDPSSMRCADQPDAPAAIASRSKRRSSACSASVGSTPALARSAPSTYVSSGQSGSRAPKLTAFGSAAIAASISGKLSQVQGSAACIAASGIDSTRVIESIARSRSAPRIGANPKPQLQATSDVTPCQPAMVQYGSQKIWAS